MKRRNCIQAFTAPSPGPLHSIHRISLFVKYFLRKLLKNFNFIFFETLLAKPQGSRRGAGWSIRGDKTGRKDAGKSITGSDKKKISNRR